MSAQHDGPSDLTTVIGMLPLCVVLVLVLFLSRWVLFHWCADLVELLSRCDITAPLRSLSRGIARFMIAVMRRIRSPIPRARLVRRRR